MMYELLRQHISGVIKGEVGLGGFCGSSLLGHLKNIYYYLLIINIVLLIFDQVISPDKILKPLSLFKIPNHGSATHAGVILTLKLS